MPSQATSGMESASSLPWLESLYQNLQQLHNKNNLQHPRETLHIAVVGIGHELRGDDAAGVFVARGLHSLLAGRDGFLVIDAGPAPENFTGQLRRYKPDLVLLVDAAQMQEAPGTIRWLDWRETSGISASTHTLPPYVLSEYLTGELGCRVALLGIQALDTSLGAPLSAPVKQAVEKIVQSIAFLQA